MRKEYTTIREVVGPLVMVDGIEGVKYDELVEIQRNDGRDLRRGKVLEVNGDKALVQLFEGSQGLKIAESRAKFLGHSIELAVAPIAHSSQEVGILRAQTCNLGLIEGY